MIGYVWKLGLLSLLQKMASFHREKNMIKL